MEQHLALRNPNVQRKRSDIPTLEAAIVFLAKKLADLSQDNLASETHFKEEGLELFKNIVKDAPVDDVQQLFAQLNRSFSQTRTFYVLGFPLSVMCKLFERDKSPRVRLKALESTSILIRMLKDHHHIGDFHNKCSVDVATDVLPGVSDALFRLIVSDTKLPREILMTGLKVWAQLIELAYSSCDDGSKKLDGQCLNQTNDQLAKRINMLNEYIMNNDSLIPEQVKLEHLNLCHLVATRTCLDLKNLTLRLVIKLVASVPASMSRQADTIFADICDNLDDRLSSTVISWLSELLVNLQDNFMEMLLSELQTELRCLNGFIRLLPTDSLTLFMEIEENRIKFLEVMMDLITFTDDQPMLFFTDNLDSERALKPLESYNVAKGFLHLHKDDVRLVANCCCSIGQRVDIHLLCDMFRTSLCNFECCENLYVSQLLLKGLMMRDDGRDKISELAFETIEMCVYKISEQIAFRPPLTTVIAIELVTDCMDILTKFTSNKSRRILILKSLLCPLLDWASSSNRATSEAAFSALNRIATLYGFDSVKQLIEENIDYIVDGVGAMLQNFSRKTSITNVLAITFKLSSIECFYYFKDIYQKLFKLLSVHFHTSGSKSIALLFYRTLVILSEWKGDDDKPETNPLSSDEAVQNVMKDISIELRLRKLRQDSEKAAKFRAGNFEGEEENLQTSADETAQEEKKDAKADDVVLTEQILIHCVNLISSNFSETKIYALKAAAVGLKVLRDDEDTLLPLVHKLWGPLVNRLTNQRDQDLEISASAFECLVSMALYSRDFIRRRTLDLIIPRLCLFLESQAPQSKSKREYGPYCMTVAYKCQLTILSQLGALAYHTEMAYSSLWRIVRALLVYLESNQPESLRQASHKSLLYIMALDPDCVWYYSKQCNKVRELPFELLYSSYNY